MIGKQKIHTLQFQIYITPHKYYKNIMTSVKERIAALQKKSGESTLAGGVGSGAMGGAGVEVPRNPRNGNTVNTNVRRSASLFTPTVSSSQLEENTKTTESRRKTEPISISRTKVSTLAENMKGMNLQSMLLPNQNQNPMVNIRKIISQKKDAEANANANANTAAYENAERSDKCIEDKVTSTGGIEDGTKFQHMKRAMIAPGSRRRRSPISLEGIKLSTE